jgi:tRNA dimethylallyltransferase
MRPMNFDAVLIAGPTGSGKSEAALELARHFDGAVINADSMQVYRELRILSARPSEKDEAAVPHFLYGHVTARERYSAGLYQRDAAVALAGAREQNRLPIFVGGTGLYFAALETGLSPVPQVPAAVRQSVRQRFADIGREAFFAELAARDVEGCAMLRPSDTQRILRAADVLEATGRPLSAWQKMRGQPVLQGLKLARYVVAPPRAILSERIDRRFEAMVRDGGLAEAGKLMGLDPLLPAAKALGLPQLWRHLAGEIGLQEAVAEAQTATRQYAKRQMTWFRKSMKDWKWLENTYISNLITST